MEPVLLLSAGVSEASVSSASETDSVLRKEACVKAGSSHSHSEVPCWAEARLIFKSSFWKGRLLCVLCSRPLMIEI